MAEKGGGRESERGTTVSSAGLSLCCLEPPQPRYTVNKTWQAGGEFLKAQLFLLVIHVSFWASYLPKNPFQL